MDFYVVASEIEDFEASSESIVEVPSWLDWRLVMVQSLANSTEPNGISKVHCLFIPTVWMVKMRAVSMALFAF